MLSVQRINVLDGMREGERERKRKKEHERAREAITIGKSGRASIGMPYMCSEN